jgi:hypothetical protein
MKVSFCYNGILTVKENVKTISLHQDDSHEGNLYFKIWIEDPEELYSEDHYLQNIISIEN